MMCPDTESRSDRISSLGAEMHAGIDTGPHLVPVVWAAVWVGGSVGEF